MRILPQIHEWRVRSLAASSNFLIFVCLTAAQMPSQASSRRWNLPRWEIGYFWSRWTKESSVLSEPLSTGQNVPRPQNPILRRRTVPLLRTLWMRWPGLPLRWVLLQRKALHGGIQSILYCYSPYLSTQRLRFLSYFLLLSPLTTRKSAGLAREATVRSRLVVLSILLENRSRPRIT